MSMTTYIYSHCIYVSIDMLELCATEGQPQQCVRSVICFRLLIITITVNHHNYYENSQFVQAFKTSENFAWK